jgi:hypothetical protein
MLSQIEVLDPTPGIATIDTEEPVHVAIDVQPSGSKVVFTVVTPTKDVTVGDDPSTLVVHPGSYFLDFNILEDTLNNPAILVETAFGMAGLTRSGARTVTLYNDNALVQGEDNQQFDFQFSLSTGRHDPTIVNTPDPV